MWGLIVGIDLLGVYARWLDGGQGPNAENALVITWFILVSFFGLTVFGPAQPAIAVNEAIPATTAAAQSASTTATG